MEKLLIEFDECTMLLLKKRCEAYNEWAINSEKPVMSLSEIALCMISNHLIGLQEEK